jgi:hypothetical protein
MPVSQQEPPEKSSVDSAYCIYRLFWFRKITKRKKFVAGLCMNCTTNDFSIW